MKHALINWNIISAMLIIIQIVSSSFLISVIVSKYPIKKIHFDENFDYINLFIYASIVIAVLTMVFSVIIQIFANKTRQVRIFQDAFCIFLSVIGIASISGFAIGILFVIAIILGPLWATMSIPPDFLEFLFFVSTFVEACGLSLLMSLLSLPVWFCAYNIIKIRENEQTNSVSIHYHEMTPFQNFEQLPV